MNILFLCAEDFYSEYPEQFAPIYGDVLKKRHGFNFFWVFRSTKNIALVHTKWDEDGMILVPKPVFIRSLFGSYISYFRNLQQVMKSVECCFNTDAIHVFDEPMMGLVAYLVKRKTKVPLIYQVTHLKEEETILYAKYKIYGSPVKNFIRGKVGLFLRNWILRRSEMVFAVSNQMKDLFITYGIKAERITVVPAGVNCSISPLMHDAAASQIRALHILEDKRVLFYMGTLSKFRKLDFILDIFQKIRLRYNDTKLMVVSGSPDDVKWFKCEASKRGVEEHLIMIKTVPRQELYGYIRLADICLAPYAYNIVNNCNSPVKLLEYLLMERVVIGTNILSQDSIINDLNAGLSVDHTVDAYYDAIVNIFDDPCFNKFSNAGIIHKYLSSYRSFDAIAETIFIAYNNLVDLRKSIEREKG
jgi:glycosyltransferase involved in cell wall biosynthesis